MGKTSAKVVCHQQRRFKQMKKILTVIIPALLLCNACAPKLGATISAKQSALPDTAQVMVIQQEEQFNNDGIAIGTIRSDDNGFSTNCSYYEVITKLKEMARQNGANIIRITKIKGPDAWSTCARIQAKIYRVPDARKYEASIVWSAGRKLTWADFKGAVPDASAFSAATSASINYQSAYSSPFAKVKFFTEAVFHCHESWVKPVFIGDTSLLRHEQGHFDLSEIYARQVRRQLAADKLSYYLVGIPAQKILDELSQAFDARQKQYDEETDHGRNHEKQEQWDKEIQQSLATPGAYPQ